MSEQSFEGELLKLESCVENLAKPNVPLKDSLNNFEQGVALFRNCQELLDQAKAKMNELKNSEQVD